MRIFLSEFLRFAEVFNSVEDQSRVWALFYIRQELAAKGIASENGGIGLLEAAGGLIGRRLRLI